MPIPPYGGVPAGIRIPTVGLLSGLPASPTFKGQSYYATDDAGGTWYICFDGSTWAQPSKRGLLGSATSTSTFTTSSASLVAITGLTTTVTVNTRPVKVSFRGNMKLVSVTANQAATIAIFLDGVQIDEQVIASQVSETLAWSNEGLWTISNPAAGSHTYAAFASVQSGSVSFVGAATFPLAILVEEV